MSLQYYLEICVFLLSYKLSYYCLLSEDYLRNIYDQCSTEQKLNTRKKSNIITFICLFFLLLSENYASNSRLVSIYIYFLFSCQMKYKPNKSFIT